MTPGSRIEELRRQDFSERLRSLGWYHSYAFPDGSKVEGVKSLAFLEETFSRFPLPPSLAGKTVLDIGAWDGWFSFAAEKRGASVTAVDYVETPHFRSVREKLQSQVDYRIVDMYDLPRSGFEPFDYLLSRRPLPSEASAAGPRNSLRTNQGHSHR